MNQNTEEIFPKRRKDFWQDSRYATRYANSVESTTSDLNDVVASTSICRDCLGDTDVKGKDSSYFANGELAVTH